MICMNVCHSAVGCHFWPVAQGPPQTSVTFYLDVKRTYLTASHPGGVVVTVSYIQLCECQLSLWHQSLVNHLVDLFL